MEPMSKHTRERKRENGTRGDSVCPALVCASQPADDDNTGHYRPSHFQIQEHCTKLRHVRCPLQRPACVSKRK
jgi:hypothetical protein